jgi:hypothetical protein
MLRAAIIAFWFGFALMLLFPAHAQDRLIAQRGENADMAGHPQKDQAIHEKFYNTWMMPDNPVVSCCHDKDCAPAESYWLNGHWMARKVDDAGDFTAIPDQKVEQGRDTPDGRSHLCGNRNLNTGEFYTYCFIAGAGG